MCIATHPMLYGYQMKELERKYANFGFDYAKPAVAGWMAEQQAGEQKAISSVVTQQGSDTAFVQPRYSFLIRLSALVQHVLRIGVLPGRTVQRIA